MSDETLLDNAPQGDVENGTVQNQDQDLEVSEFDRLVDEVEADPGCASFPRLAEAYRRDGQTDRARMIAEAGLALAPERLVGRVVLALAMLDVGEVSDAIDGLATILEDVPAVRTDAVGESLSVDSETQDEARAAVESKVESEVESAGETKVESSDGEEADSDADVVVAQSSEPEPEESSSEHRLYSTAFSTPTAPPLALPSENLPQVELDEQGDDSAVALGEDEIDQAFSQAQAEAEQMLSPDDVVEATVLDADVLDTAEEEATEEVEEEVPDAPIHLADDSDEPYSPANRPVFATETMATLLEGQGDVEAAEAIRSSIPDVTIDSYNDAFSYSSGPQTEGVQDPDEDSENVETEENDQPNEPEYAFTAEADVPEEQVAALDVAIDFAPTATPAATPDYGVVRDLNDARTERRARIVSRLEGWLENIRRDVA